MADLTVPQWLENKLTLWKDRLQMWEWEIRLRLELVLDENSTCKGLAEQWPDINMGRIAIRADVEDTEEWEITLVHELLHIKHSRIDRVVYGVLEPHVQAPSSLVDGIYRQALEPYIDSMAKVLVKETSMKKGKTTKKGGKNDSGSKMGKCPHCGRKLDSKGKCSCGGKY